jgi:hypothetical protein
VNSPNEKYIGTKSKEKIHTGKEKVLVKQDTILGRKH